jgi:predicted component of viral defense system (DUF524 family)
MSESASHIFDIPDYGQVVINIPLSTKAFYRPSGETLSHFSVKVLDKKVKVNSFYVFEWQRININGVFIQQRDSPYELIINNSQKLKSISLDKLELLSGNLVFENQVGETRIKIIDKRQQTLLELEFEVFPLKLDYKSDYRIMILELSQIIRNLTYSFLKDTYQKAKPKIQGYTTELEWWSILDELFEIFLKNIETIRRQPKHEILYEEHVMPIGKVKRGSVQNKSWFQRNTKYLNSSQGIEVIPGKYFSHALSVSKRTTYDTYENRFIVFAIKETLGRITHYRKHILSETGGNNSFIDKKMIAYQERLQSFLHQSPFDEVGTFEKRSYFSTTLTKGAGYRDFLQIFMLLNKGLEILHDDIFKIDQKEIHQLYEYWCFLKLFQLIKGEIGYEMNYQNLIKFKAGKFNVDLKKRNESLIKFKNKHGEELSLYFNKEFGPNNKKAFTFKQIPDFSLSFKKKGYEKPFWYIFDAKYRFNQNKDEVVFDAPDDAIGQLHRYRDAILHSEVNKSTYKAAIKNLGGVILYPYPKPEEDFKKSRYFKSIEEVNIGALPFLPGKTSLVQSFLHNLINEKSPEDHFEEFIEMDVSEYSQRVASFDDWVTIGVVSKANQEERLNLLLEKNIHYIPVVKEFASRIYSSNKLLACLSGTNQAYLFEIKGYEILTKKELKELGKISWSMRAERYIVFTLSKKYQMLKINPSIVPINFRYTTKGGLDIFLSDEFNEANALYINNLTAFKLYSALKRRKIDFNITWGDSKTDLSEVKFLNGQHRLITCDAKPFQYRIENKLYSLDEVLNLIIAQSHKV